MADLLTLTQEALSGMGVELIDVEKAPMGLLRIIIDRPEGVRIEDCEQVSKQLSRVYEVENIDYRRLEVTSPGVDRPLRTAADFQRFAGHRVEVKLRQAQDNQKVFVGCLLPSASSDESASSEADMRFQIALEDANAKPTDKVLSFTHGDIDRAKLNPVLDFKGKKR
ncbi:ribosome maturation factor RimP [Pusillimonas sp. CC-YST705]|uniref:Ribosome maturation factor RimP n=1 Tax=Mesopusillimonas faecipullorum TaxID=2755040 RepID=A0ABS8CD31_9BURK|nr:ribosome maturation factor RimP [Mesopusillimonas faecipullorum]MCB5363935.1 ribosome maturation factor RimP [Mesopusillimonas faecipullorum]